MDVKPMPLLIAYYQFSTMKGYVKIQMPFQMSREDAKDVLDSFELVMRQIKRRSGLTENDSDSSVTDDCGSTWSKTCPNCGNESVEVVRPGKAQCYICE